MGLAYASTASHHQRGLWLRCSLDCCGTGSWGPLPSGLKRCVDVVSAVPLESGFQVAVNIHASWCVWLALQDRCEALAKELLAVDARLQACMDVAALRRAGKQGRMPVGLSYFTARKRVCMLTAVSAACPKADWTRCKPCRLCAPDFAGMQHAAATAHMVQEILAGCTHPDPAQHGMTTEDERTASSVQVRPQFLLRVPAIMSDDASSYACLGMRPPLVQGHKRLLGRLTQPRTKI